MVRVRKEGLGSCEARRIESPTPPVLGAQDVSIPCKRSTWKPKSKKAHLSRIRLQVPTRCPRGASDVAVRWESKSHWTRSRPCLVTNSIMKLSLLDAKKWRCTASNCIQLPNPPAGCSRRRLGEFLANTYASVANQTSSPVNAPVKG